MKSIIAKILKVILSAIAIIIAGLLFICLVIEFCYYLPFSFNKDKALVEILIARGIKPVEAMIMTTVIVFIIILIIIFLLWTLKKIFSKIKFVNAHKKIFKVLYNIPRVLLLIVAIMHIVLIFVFKSGVELTDEEKMFREINEKCSDLPDTEFLDALSDYDISKLTEDHQVLVYAMRDYNLAIEPLQYDHIKEVIKRLYDMRDYYNEDVLKNLVNINIDYDIRKYEYLAIKNAKLPTKVSEVTANKCKVHFGRTPNGEALEFTPILYEDGKYLLLQTNYMAIPFNYRDLYDKSGNNLIKENENINRFFEPEKKMIKDIFIFSEEDYKKYFPDDNERNLYKSSSYGKDEAYKPKSSDDYGKKYWIRKDDLNAHAKYVQSGKLKEVEGEEEYYMLAGVRLAIWVEYPYESFR